MALNVLTTGQGAQPRRTLVQDVGVERFRQKEEQGDPRGAGDEEEKPERPPPPEVHGAVSTDRRRQDGSENGAHGPRADNVREVLLGPHVGERGASGGERGGTKEARERA